jgi:hypothetical protein
MKSLKSKVILSALVLIFALVATIGSTFAWFTVSQTVTVESFTLNVTAEDSLLIKPATIATVFDATTFANNTSAAGYLTTVTNTHLANAGYDYLKYLLRPVTAVQTGYATIDAASLNILGDIEVYTRPLTPISYTPGTGQVNNIVDGGAIQFKFWVMSQSEGDKDLFISNLNITGLIAASQTAIEGSVRIAIQSRGYLTGATIETPVIASTNSLIYSDGNNTADYSYTFLMNLPGYYDGDPVVENAFNRINDLEAGREAALLAYSTGTSHATFATDAETVITTLFTNEPQLITVTIYIEGWDAQTTNAIIASQFATVFYLKIRDHA